MRRIFLLAIPLLALAYFAAYEGQPLLVRAQKPAPETKPADENKPAAGAHEHDHSAAGHTHDHAAEEKLVAATAKRPQFPEAIVLPEIEGPTPWSDKPLLNDPDRFQIAIMTDRTGGHRVGIWMKAVERLNLLRPEFVLSVGDLIEGYTNDDQTIEAQWQEFLGFIDQMDMRFFFVAGNHDVSNPKMQQVWREKFGRAWYSFDYKGVHFLCLCSEDPVTTLGEEQLAWAKADLEKHKDARWTLVFMHKPLWVYAEGAVRAGNPDPTNWKQIEEILANRPHTVFAGHVHHYVQYDRNGMKYYHLATTGGGSRLRGVPYGEFDHITWLTMEKDGPHIALIKLDGVLAPDAVTEEGIASFRSFLRTVQVEVAPILIEDAEGISEGRIDIRLVNKFDTKVRMNATIDGLPLVGLRLDPGRSLTLTAEPGETATLGVNFRFREKVDLDYLTQTLLTANVQTVETDGAEPLQMEQTLPVVIDRRHDCPARTEPVDLDGKLTEWESLPYSTGERPTIMAREQQWQGPGDASLQFATAYDDEFLYVAGRVKDDQVLPDDELEILLDPRPASQRLADPVLGTRTYRLLLTAPAAGEEVRMRVMPGKGTPVYEEFAAAGRQTESGYEVEVAIPLKVLTTPQDANWESFQMTAVIKDVDEQGEKPAEILWRGTQDYRGRNTNFGQFARLPTK